MADEIARWQNALRELEAAAAKATRLATVIHNASAVLQNWKDVRLANLGVSFPVGTAHSINADEWPTAQELAETLKSWHDAAHEVSNAWMAIPGTEKKGLQGPGV